MIQEEKHLEKTKEVTEKKEEKTYPLFKRKKIEMKMKNEDDDTTEKSIEPMKSELQKEWDKKLEERDVKEEEKNRDE